MRNFLTRIAGPIERFIALSAASGIVLLVMTLIALLWANTPWAASYHQIWAHALTFSVDQATLQFTLQFTLHHLINDGLMTVFFLLVGLEIKRELLLGELSSPKRAALPVVGALGGMIVPALLFAAFNHGLPSAAGWGVPMATDIAFALGIVTLLGARVPLALKVFLTALAIVDDLGAVLVIAIFYTQQLNLPMLFAAACVLTGLFIANRLGVRSLIFYALAGSVLWWFMLQSGIHATLAGVLLALFIPARNSHSQGEWLRKAQAMLNRLLNRGAGPLNILTDNSAQDVVHTLETSGEHIQPPLYRMEQGLHGVVAFVIMPLFALANAGITFRTDFFSSHAAPLSLGIVAGLVIGKPLGITGLCWLSAKLGWVGLPAGCRWRDLFGVSLLAGIGFTMSIFIGQLAFPNAAVLNTAKTAILLASFMAAVLGSLWIGLRKSPRS